MTPLQQYLIEKGIRYHIDQINIDGSFYQVPSLTVSKNQILDFIEGSRLVKGENASYIKRVMDEGSTFGLPPISEYIPKLVYGIPITQKIEQKIIKSPLKAPKKIRYYNEYEGDYDLARKYEVYPFLKKGYKGIRKKIPKLDLQIDFGVTASMDNHTLQHRYMFVYDILSTLLSQHVQVNLSFYGIATSVVVDGSHFVRYVYPIKKYSEYLSLGKLLPYFQVEFWRQVGFLGLIYHAELQKKAVDAGLGRIYNTHSKPLFKKVNTDLITCSIPITHFNDPASFWSEYQKVLNTL